VAVRTKRLASGRITTATATVVYTCPTGETAIVKQIWLFNVNATVSNEVGVLFDLATNAQTPLWEDTLVAREGLWLDLWTVLLPGDRIGLKTSVAGGINFLVSGTELEGLAD
jgi:hypothetical protein